MLNQTAPSFNMISLLLRCVLRAHLAQAVALAWAAAMYWLVLPRAQNFVAFWYDTDTLQNAGTQHLQDFTAALCQLGIAVVAILWLVHVLFVLATAWLSPRGVSSDAIDVAAPGLSPAAADSDRTSVRTVALNPDDYARTIHHGRYRVDRLLASGGMGSVHGGFDNVLQRKVAIKQLDVHVAQDPEQASRFRQEALVLAGLTHPYIVPVYDLVEDNGEFWIVMELLPGGDMERMIAERRPDIRTAVGIIRKVAEGLAFAHRQGMVHRDIKPMNILFSADGTPKLVDFGVAKLVQSQRSLVATQEGLSLGSPTYMSPEQATGSKDIDNRSDIYSLGVTFYKLLTGEVPFSGDVAQVMAQHVTQAAVPPSVLNAAIPADLDAIVLKMLAKDREARYPDLESFIAALDGLDAAALAGAAG